MLLSDFDFSLSDGFIATHPTDPRDSAKLLVVDRKTGKVVHSHFYDLPNFLTNGDFLVFNSSKVILARLFGKVGDKDIEILLVRQEGLTLGAPRVNPSKANVWQVMAKPGKRLKEGSQIRLSEDLVAEVLDISDGVFRLKFNLSGSNLWKEIERIGEMPLPPYILKRRHEKHEEKVDKQDYQTIYADKPGSVAAPTAGLHFTDDLMRKLQAKGCDIGFVDLHVGLGTFEPIRTENIEDHKIHSENFELSAELAEKLNKAKKEGRRIIAVGTTTVRVLETVFGSQGTDHRNAKGLSLGGETNIYIYPGYKFQFVDGLITNFHLPKSSLLLLVSAFWTKEKILEVYEEAIKNDYRLYSYGDGMFIV